MHRDVIWPLGNLGSLCNCISLLASLKNVVDRYNSICNSIAINARVFLIIPLRLFAT